MKPERPLRLADHVYGQLLELIAQKRFSVGDRIPTEKVLSETFSVSRPVVRAALQRLQNDGVVESRQGSGTYVQRQPPARLVHFAKGADVGLMLRGLELRIHLEGMNARYAALRHEPRDLTRIEAALDAMRSESHSGGMSSRRDYDFHLAVAEASHNELAVKVLDDLRQTLEQTISVALSITRESSVARQQRVVDEHERVFRAIAKRDPDSAELAMRYHLDQARNRLLDNTRDA